MKCFKAYDLRGRVPDDLNEDIAYGMGRAFARVIQPGRVVLGRDIRDSSPMLQDAIARGLMDEGVDVADIGLCGTEEVYFATAHLNAGGGMMITASHNPIGDNGVKIIGAEARPISRANGLAEMEEMVEANEFGPAVEARGQYEAVNIRPAYVERVLSFVKPATLRPLKVLVNAGNGAAGPTFDAIAEALVDTPLEFIRIYHEPDATFPNGIPNPLLPENQPMTGDAVREHGADLGVAWDGDFDRCFLFDETGAFIDGEYIVGLLAAAMLAQAPGGHVVHDPRIMWNTQRIVAEEGGTSVLSRTGHALVKEQMRAVDAVYGGEMSAHHYFRDFMYCDSGMIPMMLVLGHMSATGSSLSSLVADMRARHPSSGEINFRLTDPAAAVAAIEAEFTQGAEIDRLDGLSAAFDTWRFNLRQSNTEPVIRLNVETLGDEALLAEKTDAISALIRSFG